MAEEARFSLHTFLFGDLHRCCLCDEEDVLGEDGLCADCRKKLRLCIAPAPPPPLDGLTAGILYNEDTSSAFYRFKTKEQLYLGGFFAQYMSLPSEWRGELLVPVPLHPLRKYTRGYNQSHELALYLSSAYGLPVCAPLLKKVRLTSDQKKLNAREREKNLRRAFEASPEVAGRRIILVDDVITTGSTLSACAKALKKAGAAKVYAAAAACVQR